MDHRVLRVTETEVVTDGGFTSQRFTEERVRALICPGVIHALGDIARVFRL